MTDYHKIPFNTEILYYFNEHKYFNFGSTPPIQVVKEAVLKCVCGWHNGSTSQSIVEALGYIKKRKNGKYKLTEKGQAFLWWAYGEEGKPKAKLPSGNAVYKALLARSEQLKRGEE